MAAREKKIACVRMGVIDARFYICLCLEHLYQFSNFPQLRTAWELEKIKGLKLEQLWLEGNPLCSTFPDHSSYVRYIPANTSFPSWMPYPHSGLRDSLGGGSPGLLGGPQGLLSPPSLYSGLCSQASFATNLSAPPHPARVVFHVCEFSASSRRPS